jgi:hypothetical protein
MPKQFPNTEPLARDSDLNTSHLAGARYTTSGKRNSWKSVILTWLREHHVYDKKGGLTANELAFVTDFPHPTCHKRLPDLEHDGYVTKTVQRECQITHEQAWAWRALTAEELAKRKLDESV